MMIVGHRGARGLAPENTLASVTKALEYSVDYVEVDLRVTGDGAVVLHHNRVLKINSSNKFVIKRTKLQLLKTVKPDLATLDELLELMRKKQPILILEIKPGVNVRPIVKVIKQALKSGYPLDKLVIGSKSQRILILIRKSMPEIGLIVIEPWSGIRARLRSRQVKTSMVSMNQLWLWRGFLRATEHSDYQLFAYTLNDPEKAKLWEKYGLDGVITDFPDKFSDF
jgi:glycerophosphoryl diester phosphodiesterase